MIRPKEDPVTRSIHRTAACGLAALGLVAVLACSADPQAQFEDATERLADARAALESARADEQDAAAALEEARVAHQESQAAVAEAQRDVAEAEDGVRATASDDVLFRAVQMTLLEELRDVSIDAGVSGGVVTLSGTVPDEKVRARAQELAASIPGVLRVENRIQVPAPPSPAEQQT